MATQLPRVVRHLSPLLGVEVDGVSFARPLEPEVARSLVRLLDTHRLLLLKSARALPAAQLNLSAGLGRLAGRERSAVGDRVLPEMRIEANCIGPESPAATSDAFSQMWHSDLSWSRRPADFTVLQALEAATGCAPTELADTQAAYAALPDAYIDEVRRWKAFHHVQRSRALRWGVQPSRGDLEHQRIGWIRRQIRRRRAAWHTARRQAVRLRARTPQPGGPQGALHAVVQQHGESRKPYILLGDHAWRLAGFGEEGGLAAIDELNAKITADDHVYRHVWQPGDVLVFDNLSLLHRRGRASDDDARRVLRRTMVWRRTSGDSVVPA